MKNLGYELGFPVSTYWDLGINDSTAIWFYQYVRGEHRVIDYYEASGEGLEHYAKMLKEKPYIYADVSCYLPHDGNVRDLGSGRKRVSTLEDWGFVCDVDEVKMKVMDGIHAVRMFLRGNVFFDVNACDVGLDALASYQREFDNKLEVWREKPARNWATHGADAFRLLAVKIGHLSDDVREHRTGRRFIENKGVLKREVEAYNCLEADNSRGRY